MLKAHVDEEKGLGPCLRPMWMRKMGLSPRGCSPDHYPEHFLENKPMNDRGR